MARNYRRVARPCQRPDGEQWRRVVAFSRLATRGRDTLRRGNQKPPGGMMCRSLVQGAIGAGLRIWPRDPVVVVTPTVDRAAGSARRRVEVWPRETRVILSGVTGGSADLLSPAPAAL